ncbi:MAG: DNA replication/repair protein RecF [Oscillospiraceae bacterium]|nr:DNA replication/repair protein RecF [Oscillospiraceae bacterium]
MAKQQINTIEITGYRNLKELKAEFSPDINIIRGENAQGKTNFMEAVWLLSGGKSFRGTKDKDMIGFGQDSFRIEGNVSDGERDENIVIACSKTNPRFAGRMAKLAGGEFTLPSRIAGSFYRVIFSPVHLNIVSGGPALRRKFADACLCQMYPKFIEDYKKYNHVLDQRNNFLKTIKNYDKDQQEAIFDTFDMTLSALGYEIYRMRVEFCRMMQKFAGDYYEKISMGKEQLTFVYRDMGKTRDEIMDKLVSNRSRDIALGYTGTGIHREDIDILLNGMPAREYASQGQQRSIVIAMKLAEGDIMEQCTGTAPVILLDDVLSELDFGRQDYLLNNIRGRQVLITSCDEGRIQLSGSKKFYVDSGCVTEG